MAININIQNKVVPDISMGSIVRSRFLGKDVLSMIVYDRDNHYYRLLDLKSGYVRGQADFVKELVKEHELEFVTNEADMTLYNVENKDNNKEEK